MMFAEGLLHWMQAAVARQALYCRKLRSADLNGEHRATLHRASVDVDDAGATLAGIAADVRPGHAEILSQHLDEQRARFNLGRDRYSVEIETDRCWHR